MVQAPTAAVIHELWTEGDEDCDELKALKVGGSRISQMDEKKKLHEARTDVLALNKFRDSES